MIKIEFPANRPDIAFAMGEALMKIGGMTAGAATSAERVAVRGEDGHANAVDQATIDANECADLIRSGAHVVAKHGVVDVATGAVLAHNTLEGAGAELAPAAGDNLRRDMKGVAFDAAYCANAAEPFYSSGKTKGQWKTKRGVTEEAYTAWYAAQLANTAPAASDEDSDPTPTVQTGAAFGAAVVSTVTAPAPRNAGEFMAWVAEKQTAGRLAQDVINAAYVQLGVRVQDLFPPTPENIIANNIAALHTELSRTAGV